MAEEGCTHDCSGCAKSCADRKEKFDFSAKLNAASQVRRVIAVASGKGGVGKSFVTAMLAVAAARRGLNVGILDADITGPSIPKAFGLSGGTIQGEHGIEPVVTDGGIRVAPCDADWAVVHDVAVADTAQDVVQEAGGLVAGPLRVEPHT